MAILRAFLSVFLVLLLSVHSSPTNAQATIVVDPTTGMTITITEGQPLTGINTDPNATSVYTGDDGVAYVPLPFDFPFYDQTFDKSWMYTNGAISFTNESGNFCCNGENLDILYQNGSLQYNYSIMPMWADLYSNPGQMYYLGTEDSMTYAWYGVTEYGTAQTNSFELELYKNGGIDMRYADANVTNHNVTLGLVGDMSQGQYQQFYNGTGYNLGSTLTVPNICDTNPLASQECPGYAAAYFAQQCSANPLYDSACIGYQEAYYNQQCALNPLYDEGCNGYENAYFELQCSLDPLYDVQCAGYEKAYHDKQCSLNALYASDCPGYAEAYFAQQCTANQLYDAQCPEYQKTYALTYVITPEQTPAEPLEQFLSVSTTPDLTTYTQETLPGMQTETVTIVQEAIVEEKKSNEEIVSEVLGPSSKKDDPNKKKEQIAAKIAELKTQLTSVNDPKKQEELQNVIAALISYVPGFDAYYIAIPDAPFYQQEQAYQNQVVPENTSGLRMGLASELKYDEMIQMQYNRRK